MRIIVEKIFIGALSLIILACGNTKNNDMKNENPLPALQAEGVVQVSEDDGACKLWIMSTHTSAVHGFYPVNLEEKFKVHGMKVGFNFDDSRAPLPDGCFILKAFVVKEVVAL